MNLALEEKLVDYEFANGRFRTPCVLHGPNRYVHEGQPILNSFAHVFWHFQESPVHSQEGPSKVWPKCIPWCAPVHVQQNVTDRSNVTVQERPKEWALL